VGTDTFTYTITDGKEGTDTATVVVTITPVNDCPTAVDDAVTTFEDTNKVVFVLANDSDVDGVVDTLTLVAEQSITPGQAGAQVKILDAAKGKIGYT